MAKYLFLILVLLFSNQAFSESNVSKLEKPILSTINKGEISNLASLAFPKGKKNARRYISDSDIEGLDITFRNTLSLSKHCAYLSAPVWDVSIFIISI